MNKTTQTQIKSKSKLHHLNKYNNKNSDETNPTNNRFDNAAVGIPADVLPLVEIQPAHIRLTPYSYRL